jgi:hypothetical protein
MPALQLHPDFSCEALDSIAVKVSRGAALTLCYQFRGDLTQLQRGELQEPQRTDDLWKSTCIEAFLREPGTDGYLEFNFAPSRQWAAYSFTGYREGMRDLVIATPSIGVTANNDNLSFQVELDLREIAALPSDSVWEFGLSAVIEETGGRKSYWALRHPPGKPDFHHPDCFALELPPP